MENKIEILRQQFNELHQQDWNQVNAGTKARIWAEKREAARAFALKIIEGKVEDANEILWMSRNTFQSIAQLVSVTGVPHFFNLVLNIVAKVTGIHPAMIKQKGRKGDVINARHIFCHLVHNIPVETDGEHLFTLKSIGRFLSGRDHSTIINSCSKCSDYLEIDALFREQYYACKTELMEQLSSLTVDKVA